jgi:hypothetical protein
MKVLKFRKNISIELFIIYFWILLDLVQLSFILYNHILVGDFFPWQLTVDNITIIIIFSFQCLLYFLTYKFYIFFIKQKRILKVHINFNKTLYKFIDWFFFLLLILNFIFYLQHISNPVGIYKPNSISFIIHLIDITAIFPFYYFLNRNKGSKILYITNIIVYLIIQIAKGWSGIFLQLFLFELYFRSKGKINLLFFLILPLFFIIGIFIYQYIYPLKLAIRSHSNISILTLEPIPFSLATILLIGRLSMIGNLITIFQYKNDILYLLNNIYPWNFEILKFIRNITPSFIASQLFPQSIFLYGTIGNVLWFLKTGNVYELNTTIYGFGPTLLGSSYLLLLRNPMEFILFYLLTIFVIFYIKAILDTFNNKDVYFPFYLILIYFVHEAGETSVAFAKVWFSLTAFFIVILFAKLIINKIIKSNANLY